jgi:hypothetical protein
LNTCWSAALVDGDDVGRSDGRGLSLGAGSSPSMSAQVGTARGGVREGGEVNCCVLLPRWLDRPATPMGEAGGRGRGVEAWPTLARCDPSTPWWGEGWGWAGGSSRAILPWPPGKGGGGDGRGCGAGELGLTAHHECWQATERMLAGD